MKKTEFLVTEWYNFNWLSTDFQWVRLLKFHMFFAEFQSFIVEFSVIFHALYLLKVSGSGFYSGSLSGELKSTKGTNYKRLFPSHHWPLNPSSNFLLEWQSLYPSTTPCTPPFQKNPWSSSVQPIPSLGIAWSSRSFAKKPTLLVYHQ